MNNFGIAISRLLPSNLRPPLSTFGDIPVVNEHSAAEILGVSAERLKKWRQRTMGPDYIQFGHGDPVRYEVNALKAFREVHRVTVVSKR